MSAARAKTVRAGPVPIEILIEDPRWQAEGDLRPVLRRAARRALRQAEGRAGPLTLLLTDDPAVRRLNREFRGKDKPTNVLSFPAPANPEGLLGDIALAYGVTAREAAAGRKSLADHAAHLVVHGVLHLLGYDHETEAEAAIMEPLETAILAGLGIADPYAARAPA